MNVSAERHFSSVDRSASVVRVATVVNEAAFI